MTWTLPKTFASGDILTAADMNTHLRDNLKFLFNGATSDVIPVLSLQGGTSQGFTANVNIPILFQTVIEDNASNWSAGAGFYTAPLAGVYLATVTVTAPVADTDLYRIRLGYGVAISTNVDELLRFTPADVTNAERAIVSSSVAVRLAANDHIAAVLALSVGNTLSVGESFSLSYLHP